MQLKLLAVGDVVGVPGVRFLSQHLRSLRKQYEIDFCVVNGENASVVGLADSQAEEILDAGADVITLGNHAFANRRIHDYLDESPYILRPLNYAPQRPGRGWGVYDTKAGPIAVINLIGRCNMNFGPDNPFLQIAPLLDKIDAKMCVIDFHAEATSEKLAMARLLDGRISALWGTHTHIPTADCRVLSGGTGYQTDLGMTGPSEGVLGIRTEQSIANFRGDLTSRYEAAPGPCVLQGAVFTLDGDTGRCLQAEAIEIC
ncbi:MAG: YmdB family metallophosphoesterase [Oscillospiraceae bacterium]|nr:YmdB family metallophosphoesterase [Oscillospiraceae bacterium]